jgi:hypothetical protein
MDIETLRAAGETLFGERWQMPMARALGSLHPAGSRDSLDIRAVQRWVAGDRPVPAWIDASILLRVVDDQRKRHVQALASLDRLERDLRRA